MKHQSVQIPIGTRMTAGYWQTPENCESRQVCPETSEGPVVKKPKSRT